MKKIMLCRREGGCCPHIEEEEGNKNGFICIIDGDQKIVFNKEQQQKLAKYLCKRLEPACKCAICNP